MGKVRSRRPAVLQCLHAIDARRLQERRSWAVSFSILRPFGPSRATATPRAGLQPAGPRGRARGAGGGRGRDGASVSSPGRCGGGRGARAKPRGAGAPARDAIVGPAGARRRELVAVPALRRPAQVESLTARSHGWVSLEPRERGAGCGRARAVWRRPGHARRPASPG